MARVAIPPTRLGRLHEVMAGHVDAGAVPGLVTLVSHHGEVHVDAIGSPAVDGAVPMGRDTIFRISSMTKPITAAAAMVLVEECGVRLDDPIDEWIPELADRRVLRTPTSAVDDTVPAQRPITLRDLLTFRMGHGMVLADPATTPILAAIEDAGLGAGPPLPTGQPPPDEWLRRLGTLPLLHQPGEEWHYNTGSDVAGILIARASGQSFEAFLRERIFDPLAMADTGFTVAADQAHRLATSYLTDPATGALSLFDPAEGGAWTAPPPFPTGSAGLVSTVDDYAAFAQMLLAEGDAPGGRVLSRASVRLMTSDQLSPAQKARSEMLGLFDHHGWGFGVAVVTDRYELASTPGRYGWDGGLGTSWWNDPAEDLFGILMTQAAWTSPVPPPVCADFWTCVYQEV